MSPKIARVTLSAIIHATENPDKIISAIQGLVPDFVARPERRRATGYYGNEIQIVQIRISNRSQAEDFLSRVWRRLSLADQKEIIDHLGVYLSESGHLHMRIDKQAAINGYVVLGHMEPIRIETTFEFHGISNTSATAQIADRLENLAL